METNYNEQAERFLNESGTVLKVTYLKHDKHFADDDVSRDVYSFCLRRNGKSYTGRFGQSIASQGQEPSAYDILACITKNDPGTFEDFCSEFGYDTDSRKAEKVYKAVVREWKGISRVFGVDGSGRYNTLLNKLQEIA